MCKYLKFLPCVDVLQLLLCSLESCIMSIHDKAELKQSTGWSTENYLNVKSMEPASKITAHNKLQRVKTARVSFLSRLSL